MKRRKFLIGLPILTGGALATYFGYKWIRWNIVSDLDYLDQSKDLLISLSDTIIPKTDSPSASECGVHEFIVKMVKDCTDIITQNKFIDGLKDLEDYVQSEYGDTFIKCTKEQKIQVLEFFEQRDKLLPGLFGKVQNKYLGKSFSTTLKTYCSIGYFTSEGGATQALRYSHVPSKYNACELINAHDKAWATN